MYLFRMRMALPVMLAAYLSVGVAEAQTSPIGSPDVNVTYVRLGPTTEGFLLEPKTLGEHSNIAMVFSHPNRDNYGERPGWFMAQRGYRVLLVNYRGDRDFGDPPPENYLPSISLGISHMRAENGVEKVILLSHSGGTHIGSLYQNVAENGPEACSDEAKIFPCSSDALADLEPADGIVLLDPTLGAGHLMTAVDPAVTDEDGRDVSLDMLSADNGFVAGGKADYSPEFISSYYAAQAKRNNAIIESASERLKAIANGDGEFGNDEPFLVRGIGIRALGARLYQTDIDLQSHTKVPHVLLAADGREDEQIITSVREPLTNHAKDLNVLGSMNYSTTVRNFLAGAAIRANDDFAMTEDDIVGVDWQSAYSSSPGNATGIRVPALVMTMTCHYLVVPGEVIFDRLGSIDKTYVGVEGATHLFEPCKPEYGDTADRTFDYVERWVAEAGRF